MLLWLGDLYGKQRSLVNKCNLLHLHLFRDRRKIRLLPNAPGDAMETTRDLLNALRERAGSDRKAAAQLGVSQQSFSSWRRYAFPEDDHAKAIADALGLDPAHVLAIVYSDRAKSPETRAVWQRIAATFSKAAGAAALAIGAGLVAPSPAQAFNIIPFSAQAGNTHCVQKRRRISRTTAFAQAVALTLGMGSHRF